MMMSFLEWERAKEVIMEDLWRVKGAGVDFKDLADEVEYHRFLDRFNQSEEDAHRRDLLYGDQVLTGTDKAKTGR